MANAKRNDVPTKIAKGRLWFWQSIEPIYQLAVEGLFGDVAALIERIERVGEAIVRPARRGICSRRKSSSRASPGVSDICFGDPGRGRRRIQNHTADVPGRVYRDARQIDRTLSSSPSTKLRFFPTRLLCERRGRPFDKRREDVAPDCWLQRRRARRDRLVFRSAFVPLPRELRATTLERRRCQNMRSFTHHSNTEFSYSARLMPVRDADTIFLTIAKPNAVPRRSAGRTARRFVDVC